MYVKLAIKKEKRKYLTEYLLNSCIFFFKLILYLKASSIIHLNRTSALSQTFLSECCLHFKQNYYSIDCYNKNLATIGAFKTLNKS